jgi:hypothetical protein
MNSIKKVGKFVADNYNSKFVSKVTGVGLGWVGLKRGASDFTESFVCQDKICMVVSAIGCTADAVQILASFGSGPNATIPLTQPISTSCKTFVWACRSGRLTNLPWGLGKCN